MTQIEAMSRLVAWFGQQDEVIQTSLLHNLSEGSLSALAKTYLARTFRA